MIRITLVLLVALLVIPRLRRRSAAERHLMWAASLAAASLLPILSVLLPPWNPEWARLMMGVLPPSFDTYAFTPSDQAATIVVRATGIESSGWTLSQALTLLWIAGSAVAMSVLAVEALRLRRLARSAEPIEDHRWQRTAAHIAQVFRLTRPIRLLHSGDKPSPAASPQDVIPMTWGIRHPCVMLPRRVEGWTDDRRLAVLAHELAHVRRGDWIVHILAEVVCAAYWFHPLFWLAKSQLCRESEHAADDEVLRLGVDNGDYATHLLEIVRATNMARSAWSPTVAMARSSHLERRFAALLNAYTNRSSATKLKLLGAVAVAVFVVFPLAAVSLGRVGIRIAIRTSDLPAITETGMAIDERPAPPVRDLRVVGLADTADAITLPEIVEYTTPPLYSNEARSRGIEGIVTVGADVGADGRISGTRLVKGLGFGLDQNALVALRQWRFRPGTRGGAPIAMSAEIDVEFNLRNEAINQLIANDMATRVGPGVTPPHAVRMFGLWSRRDRKPGTVVLDVVLLEDGRPKIVRILQSLDPELDEGAVKNFEQWRFTPAMKNGRPVKVRMNAEVTFHG